MTNLPTFTVTGVPLTLLDVGDPRLTGPQIGITLSGLEQVHMRHFSDYPHMIEEIGRWREDGWPDPDVVVHNWLALHDGGPVGEFLVHTNTRRGIILFHFFAVDLEIRRAFPRGWLSHLTNAFLARGQADCAAVGRHLLGCMCEVPDDHVRKWTRQGFRHLPMEYGEPAGGRYHATPVEYIHQAAVVRTMPRASALPPAVVSGQAVRAFLLDYYGLPTDEPQVRRMLEEVDGEAIAS